MSNPTGDEAGFAEMARLVRSFQVSKMLEVAASLKLADHVDDNPRHVEELARDCTADPAMLARLLRSLAAFGVFTVDADGNVGHTQKSRWLRAAEAPTLHHAVRYWLTPGSWTAWGRLEDAIRTGDAPFEAIHGMPYFEYLRAHPNEADLFNSFMQNSPDDRHTAVVEAYDFSPARIVVDVGGGKGALLASILSANPEVRGLLYDREAVVAAAPEILGSHRERCSFQSGDFFEEVPSGGDVYTLSLILHDWSDERCLRILTNCRAAMDQESRLLIIERVLDATPGQSEPTSYLTDMHMMLLFPGAKERTFPEYSQLLKDAGFEFPNLISTRSPIVIIETRPVA